MRERIAARETLMMVILRHATEADAKHVVSLLAELGYPSTEADVHDRLCHSLHGQTSCFLVAQSASDVIGLISAELVPIFRMAQRFAELRSRRLVAASWPGYW